MKTPAAAARPAAVPAAGSGASPDLSIVIVSYNVCDYLRACLASIADATSDGPTLEVFVVDNASTDGTAAVVRAEFPWVRLIVNSANLGFTRANNLALRLAAGRHVVLLNPDTTLDVSPDGACPLATLVNYLDRHPGVGAVGPRLVYPDGSVQSSRRRFPTLATALTESTLVERFWPDSPPIRRYRMADRPDDVEQAVDWLVGACIAVRRPVLESVGGLDEGFFMYSEELDWCRRITAAGWRIAYLPSAVVRHHEGKSSEQNQERRNILFHESKCRYFAKHHGALVGEALRVFLLATFILQALEELAKLAISRRDRPTRWRRAAMLARVALWQAARLLRLVRPPGAP